MKRQRLDLLVVQRGLAPSREQARRLILAGEVLVAGHPAAKPGHEYAEDAEISIRQPPRFVSRGGFKLEEAFLRFPTLSAEGKICLDVGASTGGFTDCLLQKGAARVYALDVGRAQLHPRLAADPRVIVLDGVNARNLESNSLPEAPALAVADVSFISLQLILPAIDRVLLPGGEVVALIKPQFEAGRSEVGRGGVVRDPAIRQHVVERLREFGTQTLGWMWLDVCPSPLPGPAGNVEFLSYWRKPS